MIDRHIRETRSKEETKKARRQAVITIICLLVVVMIISKVKGWIFYGLTGASTALLPVAWLLATVLPMFLIALALYGVYKYGKSREKRQE